MGTARGLVRLIGRVLRATQARRPQAPGRPGRGTDRPHRPSAQPPGSSAAPPHGARPYPGDFTGDVSPAYAPNPDGDPDPGEIVWTWVPFEEDYSRGKDRPVLLIGRDGVWLLALMLSTRDHDTDPGPRDEAWIDIGAGPWDAERRPSEVRVDRVIRVDAGAVRREGAVLDRARFDLVAGSLRASRG